MSFINVNNPDNFTIDSVNHGGDSEPMTVRVHAIIDAGGRGLIDLTHLASTIGFDTVQCIFIDNADHDGDIEIRSLESGQMIRCKTGRQGYYPILAPRKARFEIVNRGKSTYSANLVFMNFTIAQGEW